MCSSFVGDERNALIVFLLGNTIDEKFVVLE